MKTITAGAFARYFATSPLAQRNLIDILAEAIDPEMAFAVLHRSQAPCSIGESP